ncbi:MAG: DUF3842 family protein [Oscillospiraceae bacterium]|nr:DUF3842 family protein [Oscillospiraceae bacterium]
MKVTVIDGHGGLMGAQLIKEILSRFQNIHITAVGTNSAATAAMLKAGAKEAATGENPVVVACRKTDVIIGPVGIVIADSMLGEVTPKMAVAVGQADAVRILLPMNRCENLVAGIKVFNMSSLIEDAMSKLQEIIREQI